MWFLIYLLLGYSLIFFVVDWRSEGSVGDVFKILTMGALLWPYLLFRIVKEVIDENAR